MEEGINTLEIKKIEEEMKLKRERQKHCAQCKKKDDLLSLTI